MLFYPWFWDILFVLAFFCVELSVSTSDTASSIPSPESSKKKLSSTTNVALSSEGGPLVPDAIGLTLLQGNYSIPAMLTDEGKNKVVARKGVVYSEGAPKPQEKSLSSSTENTTNKVSTSGDRPKTLNEPLKKATGEIGVVQGNSISVDKNINSTKKANNTKHLETPKKPLILEASKLENMTVKTTVVSNQMQPPKSSYITSTNSPGMVMPIVISILLVPMFVVLGYMALRRGQEAWKNRHYKRMDFLLDGMYND